MPELIAFIGGGQMAASLIGGLRAAGHPAARLRVAEPDAARAEVLRREHGVAVHPTAREIVTGADALVLAVKPQVMKSAVSGLPIAPRTTVVSIAAGIRIDSLRAWLGASAPVVRAMPNTPALHRAGITGLYAPPSVTPSARELAEKILHAVGKTCWVKSEALLDAVTAVSGSGPAYFFLLAEAMQDAGVALGLDRKTARLLAEQTLAGAGTMAGGAADLATLRTNVTSKGGTTEAAIAHFEKSGLRALVADAVRAAAERGRELGDAMARA
jgi:pyrroline-5-carboxylate reductase